jgi:hypothetical protein
MRASRATQPAASARATPDQVVLRISAPPGADLMLGELVGIRDRVEAIVQTEAQCCAFLNIEIRHEQLCRSQTPEHHVQADIALGRVAEALGDRPDDLEAE